MEVSKGMKWVSVGGDVKFQIAFERYGLDTGCIKRFLDCTVSLLPPVLLHRLQAGFGQ